MDTSLGDAVHKLVNLPKRLLSQLACRFLAKGVESSTRNVFAALFL